MTKNFLEELKNGIRHIWIWLPEHQSVGWTEAKEGNIHPCISMRLDDWPFDISDYYKFEVCCEAYNRYIGKLKARTKIACMWDFVKNVCENDLVLACRLSKDGKQYTMIGWCTGLSGCQFNDTNFNQYSRDVKEMHDVDDYILPVKPRSKKLYFTRLDMQDAIDLFQNYPFE